MTGLPVTHCPNCNTEFTDQSTQFCPGCGRVRAERSSDGFAGSSFRVTTDDGTEIGPVPLATIEQMLKDGFIKEDTPILDENLNRVIFADEHPMLRRALGKNDF